MLTFNKFIREKNLLVELKDFYDIKSLDEKQENFLIEVFKKIMNAEFEGLNSVNIDLIGNIYEKTVDFEYRKNFGEVYTPINIVSHILKSIGYAPKKKIRNKKLIDISCGAGSFLIESVKILKCSLLNYYKYQKREDISIEIAKKIINEIRKNIFGIDLNPIACILCQLNLFLSIFDLIKIIHQKEPEYQFSYFNVKNVNALNLSNEEKYDFVVGNPPYLFIREISHQHKQMIEKGNFETNIGQYDYYQIFIEIGIKKLKNHGLFGYIIPDSILALSNRKIIRKFILAHSNIKEISVVGSQFEDPVVSNVVLILEKENDIHKRMANIIKIIEKNEEHYSKKVLNQSLIKKFDYKFLIYLTSTDVKILEHLNENFPKLGNLMSEDRFEIILSRGVELGKEGKIVYCEICQKYLPLPKKGLICPDCKNLIDIKTVENIIHKKIPLRGKNEYSRFIYKMNRYQINEIKYINVNKNGINYKDKEIYKDRVIIRQLSQDNLICATYSSNSYTSQSFYNLKIVKSDLEQFNNYYLLGLINSRLLSYYYNKSFGLYKKLFPRILIEKIKNLPIKVPQTENEQRISLEIINLVKKILLVPDTLKDLEKQLNSLIFELYEISEENRIYISQNIMKIN
ncbi:MAG: Eco57I restriction-modification methylase domain-containing protein [Promethearchaeota archaeon]